MYYQQQTTKLEAMGPMPIDPGPDLVCRMAARSFAQVRRRLKLEKAATPPWRCRRSITCIADYSADPDFWGCFGRRWEGSLCLFLVFSQSCCVFLKIRVRRRA
jgi:hypothetical protein